MASKYIWKLSHRALAHIYPKFLDNQVIPLDLLILTTRFLHKITNSYINNHVIIQNIQVNVESRDDLHGVYREYKMWYLDGTSRFGHMNKIFDVFDNKVHNITDNQLKIYCCFVNKKKHGEYMTWWKNGIINSRYTYTCGRINGMFTSWDINGIIHKEHMYVNGVKHGVCKDWWNNDNLCKLENYINGKKHGRCVSWWIDGSIRSDNVYVNGEKLSS